MIKYIAFLRGINVGGQNIIKMDDITGAFKSLGFENVRTYIQTGNVTFESEKDEIPLIVKNTEEKLLQVSGSEILVMLRVVNEIEKLIKSYPFRKYEGKKDVKRYITFLYSEPIKNPALPAVSGKKDVEVFQILDLDVFSLGLPYKNRFGFPNKFIENEFGVPATTRNWNTILRTLK